MGSSVPSQLGESTIAGKRNEPFNPFAKDASQQYSRRRTEKARQDPRPSPTQNQPLERQQTDRKAELERKQKEAQEILDQQGDVSTPANIQPAQVNLPQKDTATGTEPAKSRAQKMEELRKKTQELKASTQATMNQMSEQVVDTVQPELKPIVKTDSEIDEDDEDRVNVKPIIKSKANKVKNVFKKIETVVDSNDSERRRGKNRSDKRGGGRQRQERKLNRQKQLEYRYAAKEILSNQQVPENERSNVLAQVWAKGERIGIHEAISFIEQKEEEHILPAKIAQEMRDLVKRMTTMR